MLILPEDFTKYFKSIFYKKNDGFIFEIIRYLLTTMATILNLLVIGIFALMTFPGVSSIVLICKIDNVNCDGNVIYSRPAEYFGNVLADTVQARLFSNPEYEGSQLDVPEGMTELAGYPIEGGSIVVREGWRVVITTLHGGRFVERIYVLEGDIPHVSFAGVRIMRVLVEKI